MKVKVPPRKVFQYRRADYEGMKRELRATLHDFQQMAETEDTEHLWTTFKKKTHSLMDKFIPSKMLRGNKSQKPWVTKQVKGLRRKQKVLFKRQHKTGAAKDIRQYRETKARLQKAERQSYWKYIENIVEVGNPDQEYQPKQKRLFNFIKSLRRDNSGIAPLKEKGRLHADPKDKAEIASMSQHGQRKTQKTYQSQMAHPSRPWKISQSLIRELLNCC